jgi:uncharacterized membrane protein YukC
VNKKQSQSGSAHLIIVIVLVVALLGALGFIVYQNFIAKPTDNALTEAPKALIAGDFGNNGDYGTFQVRGYATANEVQYMPGVSGPYSCHDGGCVTNDYIYFNVVKTENTHILDYLIKNHGSSYVQDNAIGMGCVENNAINYSNISDLNGMKDFSISTVDTAKILAATAEKPIDLSIEKLNFTGTSGDAPACYSQFANFSVINE